MSKVTVVIPVFNGERYIHTALNSVFAQTYRDYEIICVDDGSTDGSATLLKQYGERIRIVGQRNAGQSAARNVGVSQARGEYIAFLDQDDLWYPSKIKAQVAVLDDQPDVVLVHCDFDRIDARGDILQQGVGMSERASALVSAMGQLIDEALIFPSAMMIRKNAYNRIGGFDHGLRGFEDFDLIARLKQEGQFVMVPERGMAWRFHGEGFNRTGGIDVIRSRERFLNRMQELYAKNRTKETIVKSMLADCYSDWGILEVRRGKTRQGRVKLMQSLRCNPTKFRTYSRLLRSFGPHRS
jgi:glycosyltransferase involved in cell wall biosynthesis